MQQNTPPSSGAVGRVEIPCQSPVIPGLHLDDCRIAHGVRHALHRRIVPMMTADEAAQQSAPHPQQGVTA